MEEDGSNHFQHAQSNFWFALVRWSRKQVICSFSALRDVLNRNHSLAGTEAENEQNEDGHSGNYLDSPSHKYAAILAQRERCSSHASKA